MPSTCRFSFDRPNLIYYSGETINGRITLHTTSEKSVRGVYIIFEGVAKVRWEESRSRQKDGKTEYYTEYYKGDETYLNTRTCVFGERTLPPGTHEYTFSIPLPIQCPTSCTEKYGSINYELSLKLDRPLRVDNVFVKPLTVIKQLNLNHSPEYLVPVRAEDVKYFCCWPCSSGPVISTLTIPFGGWAPGQLIPYTLEIDNQSSDYDLTGTQLKLKQMYSFTAHHPHHKTRTVNNTLTRLEHEDRTVLRLSKRKFEGKLRIPSVPPTSTDSGIITVHYRIEMDIHTGDCHTDSEIWMPITIGTVPLAQSATNPQHVIAIQPTAPTPDTPDSLPPSYDAFMPPTFEDATHGEKFKDTDKDEYHKKQVGGWVPQYPMYENFAVPPAASAPPPMDVNEQQNVAETRPLLNIGFSVPPNASNGSDCPPYAPSNQQCPYPSSGGLGNPQCPYPTAGGLGMPSMPTN